MSGPAPKKMFSHVVGLLLVWDIGAWLRGGITGLSLADDLRQMMADDLRAHHEACPKL